MTQTINTPRGSISVGPNGTAELKFNTNFAEKWGGQYSAAQTFVDSEVLRLCEPFVPLQTSMLIKSGILGTDIGSGTVQWIAPYSRYQYYGKVMTGHAPKKVSAKNLVYHGGGVRGAFWFERMKEVSGQNIIDGAAKIAGGTK